METFFLNAEALLSFLCASQKKNSTSSLLNPSTPAACRSATPLNFPTKCPKRELIAIPLLLTLTRRGFSSQNNVLNHEVPCCDAKCYTPCHSPSLLVMPASSCATRREEELESNLYSIFNLSSKSRFLYHQIERISAHFFRSCSSIQF